MRDMQLTAQEWIQKNSFRARQQGTVTVPTKTPAVVEAPAPEAAPEPEAVKCDTGVSSEEERLPGGFFRYFNTQGEAVRIRIPEERLQAHGLPTSLKEWLEAETEKVVVGQARIHEALAEVVVGDPEGLAAERRRNERLERELKEAYAEIAALRRATAGVGKAAGKRFFETLGQALEQDADGLLDLLDQYEDELPEAVVTYLKTMARNNSGFALNAMAYSQTI